jgi:putative aldouronate transport system permease protein
VRSSAIKRSREDVIFDTVIYVVLTLAFVVVLYPLYFVVIASFSDPGEVLVGNVVFTPKAVTFNGYRRIMENTSIWSGYLNTVFYTLVGTAINVALTTTVAYPLSRKRFSGRKAIMICLMVTMYIGGGLIPTYLLVRGLGLRDTRAIMVILGAVSVFNILITRTFFETNIPGELEEAASIDGCPPIKFFLSCVLPLSSAIGAVLVLYYGIGHWNDYMRGLIYLNSPDKYPLQMILRSILIQSDMAMGLDTGDPLDMQQQMKIAEQIKYGVIIVSSLPLLLLYPFLQKYFVKGVMIGSIKG